MNKFSRLLTRCFVLILGIAGFFSANAYGITLEETILLGERMYQKGILPNGKPLKAIVRGDIQVRGSMLTCTQCHMRSGLGSYEGTVLTPPTNGARLYAPVRAGQTLPGMGGSALNYTRPAYTDESLATVLLAGIDPAGRVLSETMPRYILNDSDMAVMVTYLKNLSARHSPGITDSAIRFATIVTDDVTAADRDAMLAPLSSYIRDEWSARVRVVSQLQRDNTYRPAELDVWELKGAPATWEAQLEIYYRQKPVFALLGGISNQSWKPVHDFCEKNRIPAILPITNLPVVSDTSAYTLYFSKGYHQEGEAVAKFLARVFDLPADRQIVQIYRQNDAGTALAQGFSTVWKKLGKAPVNDRILTASEKPGKAFWANIAAAHKNAVLLVWLDADDLKGVEAIGAAAQRPSVAFFSTSLLENKVTALPDSIRTFSFLTWPTRLPEESQQSSFIVEQWLKAKKIPQDNLAISSRVYALTRTLAMSLSSMRGEFYRDYFLDLFDILQDQTMSSGTYARLSFGPGQRYAAKGCYIISLTQGAQPKIIRQSNWVIY